MVDGNEIFNEKSLFLDDVKGEDDDEDLRRPSTPKANKKKAGKLLYYLETKYELVQEVCENQETWKEVTNFEDDFDFFWCDTVMSAERFIKMKIYQRVNHFLGMSAISRKNNLGRNLLRMKKHFPNDYKFFPDTWILPTDMSDFKAQFTGKKNKTFIIKPDNGCQGKGIFLTREFDKIPIDYSTTLVAQRYVHKPFLLDGYKFDLRIYVLVTGCDPLRVYIHPEGLVRLATVEYVPPSGKNIGKQMMHLTNYAVNCKNPDFEQNGDPDDIHDGHKRSLKALFDHLADEGHDVKEIQDQIDDLILKTLICVQPSLAHVYHSCQPDDIENRMCFEILGFDVMFDQKLKPWLIEVNHAPSFGNDSELDQVVKEQVLQDTLNMLNFTVERKKNFKRESKKLAAQRQLGKREGKRQSAARMDLQELRDLYLKGLKEEEARCGMYRKLYPTEEQELKYLPFHDVAIEIWETLTGASSRKPIRMFTPLPKEEPKEDPKEKAGDKKDGPRKTVPKSHWSAVAARLKDGLPSNPREPSVEKKESKQSEDTTDVEDKDTEKVADPASSPKEDSAKKRIQVNAGEVVKVQTNMGWEWVKVCNKYSDGRTDIMFLDGEMMHKVYPRVLRAVPGDQRPTFPSTDPSPKPASKSPVMKPASEPALNGVARSSTQSTSASSDSKPPPIGKPRPAEWVREEAPRVGGAGGASTPAQRAPASTLAAHLASAVGELGSQSEKQTAHAAAAADRAAARPPRPGSARPIGAFAGAASAVDRSAGRATPPGRRATPTPPPSARTAKRPFVHSATHAVSALRQQADELEVGRPRTFEVQGSGATRTRSGSLSSSEHLHQNGREGSAQLQNLMDIRSLGVRGRQPNVQPPNYRAERSASRDGLRLSVSARGV